MALENQIFDILRVCYKCIFPRFWNNVLFCYIYTVIGFVSKIHFVTLPKV